MRDEIALMGRNLSRREVEAALNCNLKPVEFVEMRQILADMKLDKLIERYGLNGVPIRTHMADVLGITSDLLPKTEFPIGDRWCVLGEMPFLLAVIESGEEYGIEKSKIESSKESFAFVIESIVRSNPDYPHREIADLSMEVAKDIVEGCEMVDGLLDRLTEDHPSYVFFLDYVNSNTTDSPKTYREAFCNFFDLVYLEESI